MLTRFTALASGPVMSLALVLMQGQPAGVVITLCHSDESAARLHWEHGHGRANIHSNNIHAVSA
jgi:hypothetical protein